MTWALPAIAAIILAYAAVSGRLEGTPVTAPIVFTAGGWILGMFATDAERTRGACSMRWSDSKRARVRCTD